MHQASNSLFFNSVGAPGVEFVFFAFSVNRVSKSSLFTCFGASGVEFVVLCICWCIRRRIRYLCIMGVPPKGSAVVNCQVGSYKTKSTSTSSISSITSTLLLVLLTLLVLVVLLCNIERIHISTLRGNVAANSLMSLHAVVRKRCADGGCVRCIIARRCG
jgi:hypothetical protein